MLIKIKNQQSFPAHAEIASTRREKLKFCRILGSSSTLQNLIGLTIIALQNLLTTISINKNFGWCTCYSCRSRTTRATTKTWKVGCENDPVKNKYVCKIPLIQPSAFMWLVRWFLTYWWDMLRQQCKDSRKQQETYHSLVSIGYNILLHYHNIIMNASTNLQRHSSVEPEVVSSRDRFHVTNVRYIIKLKRR